MPGSTSDLLPRIAADDRMPMQVYAAGFDSSSLRPRVGLLLAGVGLNQKDSEAAVRQLPGGITLAISPYAQNVAKLLSAARLAEHEYLLSIPMEPQGFPLNDPGNQALMTNLSLEDNHAAAGLAAVTFWRLCRRSGEREGSLRGRTIRLSARRDQCGGEGSWHKRGLLYVDPRPGRGATAPGVEQNRGHHR